MQVNGVDINQRDSDVDRNIATKIVIFRANNANDVSTVDIYIKEYGISHVKYVILWGELAELCESKVDDFSEEAGVYNIVTMGRSDENAKELASFIKNGIILNGEPFYIIIVSHDSSPEVDGLLYYLGN
jgi:hypothetical protein